MFYSPLLSFLTLHPPHSVSVLPRSEWGYGHSRTRHHGPQHPLQPPVHPAACARLPPERLHPWQHGHPHLQPAAAATAGHGPAGRPTGPAPATGLSPVRAPQGRPDPCLQEEVHQEGEEVKVDGDVQGQDEAGLIWEIQPPTPHLQISHCSSVSNDSQTASSFDHMDLADSSLKVFSESLNVLKDVYVTNPCCVKGLVLFMYSLWLDILVGYGGLFFFFFFF